MRFQPDAPGRCSFRRSCLSITPVFPLVIKLTFMEESRSWWGFREVKITRERHRMVGIVDRCSIGFLMRDEIGGVE